MTKGLTMALGVSAMAINMALHGVADSLAIMVPFLVLTVLIVIAGIALLRNIDASPASIALPRRA
jgi:hypothetical protein